MALKKTCNFALFSFLILFNVDAYCQTPQIDQDGFEIFEMQDGDSTMVMKKYFLVLLKQGENRTHPEEEAALIQTQHLAHMDSLALLGKIKLAGPMGNDGDLRGIVVYNVTSLEEATTLANQDPAIIAGRLVAEVYPWWSLKGACLE